MEPRHQSDFDWVTARRQCVPAIFFEGLAQQARRNVDAMRDTRAGRIRPRFEFTHYGDEFAVFDLDQAHRKVTVRLVGAVIETRHFGLADGSDRSATLTLDDNGECRVRLDSDVLQPWQFLRRVLEPLFFELP